MMIKEAIEYLLNTGENQKKILRDSQGKEWQDRNNTDLEELKPTLYFSKTMYISTLSSLVDYINKGLNGLAEQHLFIVVESPEKVTVYSEDEATYKERTTLSVAKAMIPEFDYGIWHNSEKFNIALQSQFLDNSGRTSVLEFASNLRIENSADLVDNGVSQVTTIKTGAASLGKAIAPNPVTLAPYRTFLEVEQPESQFVFRVNDKGQFALFEADGGAWRLQAMQNIKAYLTEHIKVNNVTILA